MIPAFWNRKNCGGSKRISASKGLGQGMTMQSTKGFQDNLFCTTLKAWVHIIINLSSSIQYTMPRVNSNINQGLWVITTCSSIFTMYVGCQQWAGCACGRAELFGYPLVLSAQFCPKGKTALKHKAYQLKEKACLCSLLVFSPLNVNCCCCCC